MFALGLIEAGAVAVMTISASTGYAVGEALGSRHSFNSARGVSRLLRDRIAAAAIAAGVILIPGAPLLSIALNANVLATVLLPVALVLLIMLANDRELMGVGERQERQHRRRRDRRGRLALRRGVCRRCVPADGPDVL